MNPQKVNQLLQDDEYQLTFLMDSPLPRRSSPRPEVAEHVLRLSPAVLKADPGADDRS